MDLRNADLALGRFFPIDLFPFLKNAKNPSLIRPKSERRNRRRLKTTNHDTLVVETFFDLLVVRKVSRKRPKGKSARAFTSFYTNPFRKTKPVFLSP